MTVTQSAELHATLGNGSQLCYQTFGSPEGDPLLLIMGLGAPMTWWTEGLCQVFAEHGFWVIRYDNRDTGKSSRGEGRVTRSMLVRAAAGVGRASAPYGLSDLAADAEGLLDHLELDSAHVLGASMGGMIAQTLALQAPSRVRSLTSMMSTTGRRTVGWQDPRLLVSMLTARRGSREEYVARGIMMSQLIGSPAYPEGEASARERAEVTWDRGFSAAGVLRHMMAIVTQPDRTRQLRGLAIPAAVIHGLADRLVHPSGGRATARAIPGAELVLIPGMGHDLPRQLWPTFAEVVRRTADRAT